MSRRPSVPPAARPAPELTPEQERAWKEDALRRLVSRIQETHEAARGKVLDTLNSGHIVPSHYMRNLAHAQHSLRAIQPLARTQGDLLEVGRAIIAGLAENVMMAARGAHNSGDMNTTCAFGRADAATQVSAQADLHFELLMILEA